MRTKPYSKALPLLGALLFGGCAQQSSNPYDVPRLLGCSLKQAEAILGKTTNGPSPTVITNNVVYWHNPKSPFFVSINYDLVSKLPITLALVPNPFQRKLQDLESVLQAGNLSMNAPSYTVKPLYKKKTVTACYGVIVTPK